MYFILLFTQGPGQSVISVHTECGTPLGLENGDVKASDIRATSTYMVPNEDYSSTLGRLNNKVSTQFGISYKGDFPFLLHLTKSLPLGGTYTDLTVEKL